MDDWIPLTRRFLSIIPQSSNQYCGCRFLSFCLSIFLSVLSCLSGSLVDILIEGVLFFSPTFRFFFCSSQPLFLFFFFLFFIFLFSIFSVSIIFFFVLLNFSFAFFLLFLVADKRLYKRLCPSVRWSVGPLVSTSRKVGKQAF